jgi:putative Holliday junction resolvase
VGVAVSDPTGTIAQALTTVQAEPRDTLVARLTRIAVDQLRKASSLPVELVDERLTTVAAERSLLEGGMRRAKRKLSVDRVAATLLLQSHLDRKR